MLTSLNGIWLFRKHTIMNDITTEAFSIICSNQDVFNFTQKYGLHGVAILNLDGSYANDYFNPKLLHSLGIHDAGAISCRKWIPRDDIKILDDIQSASESGEILAGEISFLHFKGFSIAMRYKAMHIDQKVILALKKVSDDADILNPLKLNFQREQLLGTVLNTIDVAIIACDRHGKFVLFNKAAKEWHGLPAEDIPQSEYANYYHLFEPDGTIFKMDDIPLMSMLTEGVIRKNEMIIKPIKGQVRYIVVNGARLHDENRNVVGAVVAFHDLTERKIAENQMSIRENMFRGTFEYAADGMAIFDLTGKFKEVNDSLVQMLGYSSKELKELSLEDITLPEELQDTLKMNEELLNSEKENIQKQKSYLSKNGSVVHTLLSASLVRDHNDLPVHVIAQITNISEFKAAQQQIARMLDITNDQNQRLKNFTQIVGHDLRSHLGNVEMLLNIYIEENPKAAEDETMKMALKASKLLSNTLQDLMEVAFTELPEAEKLVTINLREPVTATLDSISGLIRSANLQVKNTIPEELEIRSRPTYMESIILNFATNAIKYRSLKRSPILHFDAVEKGQYIELTIKDNGIGIDLEKNRDKLFGKYNTFNDNEDATGVGLFLTKRQIEAIGGILEVESQVDVGTTFTIYLEKGKKDVSAT